MALALRMAAMRRSGRYLFLRIMCRMLLRVARAFLLMVRGRLKYQTLRRMALALRMAAMRRSGRYLFLRIMCRMLLRVARAFLLMVVRT
ncbi:hypothetical protein MDA_GLEAN10005058 [Myotis davidii]|uniref:Uncharacterized protein n=1 Tax=Myotis davidii TaxID=225400 RepID=L5LE04_MYODS|nr:hypothetical protein MDA_GLEAN10005058 [Myotis davidii]